MIIIECEQGTPEWRESRRAMIGGTRMDSVTGSSLDRLMLACELIAEEATEMVKEFKSSAEMERGTAEEIFARKHFEQLTNKTVTQLGFCISDDYPFLGVSGDGWIQTAPGVYGEAIEIKSPDSKNAVFYKIASLFPAQELGLGSWSKPTKVNPEPSFTPSAKAPFLGIPAQYKWQVVTYFIVNKDLKKLHFLVYDARFIAEDSKMHTVTIERDNEILQDAIKEAIESLATFREFWLMLRGSIIKDNF